MAIATSSRTALLPHGAPSSPMSTNQPSTSQASAAHDTHTRLRPLSHASAFTSASNISSASFSSALSSNSSNSTETVMGTQASPPSRPSKMRVHTSPAAVATLGSLQRPHMAPQNHRSSMLPTTSELAEDHVSAAEESGYEEDPAGPIGEEHVVALHDFSSNNETCLSFRAGQIIRVFNRDGSGWWDGELNGQRGWFPSNYVDEEGMAFGSPQGGQSTELESDVGPAHSDGWTVAGSSQRIAGEGSPLARRRQLVPSFADPYADSSGSAILEPIEHSILLLQNAVRASRWAHFQPATACVISSVRSVLSATDCLTRESATLKAHPILAKERKQVLSELSRLVTQSRRASAVAADEQPVPQEMQAMLRHAANVLANTQRFLAVAAECGASLTESRQDGDGLAPGASASERSEIDKTPTPGSVRSSYLTAQTSAIDYGRNAPTFADGQPEDNLRGHTGLLTSHGLRTRYVPVQGDPTATRLRADSAATSAGTDESNQSASSNPQSQASRMASSSEAHNQTEQTVHTPSQALERLKAAHEHLVSVVAAAVGHAHTHARGSHASSYAFLIDITREAVDSVRNLLFVVEAVCDNATLRGQRVREISILLERRENLYEATTTLVTAARVVTSRSHTEMGTQMQQTSPEGEDSEKSSLVVAATTLLRTGQECVGAVRMCLRQCDDTIQIVMPNQSRAQAAKEARAEAQRLAEEAEDEDEEERTVQSGMVSNQGEPYYADSPTRGRHTLSFLGRKATSLSCLRQKYENDAQMRGKPEVLPEQIDSQFADADEGDGNGSGARHQAQAVAGSESIQLAPSGSVDMSGDTSDASDALSKYYSRASGSTIHSMQSSRTDLTTDTTNVGVGYVSPLSRSLSRQGSGNGPLAGDDSRQSSSTEKELPKVNSHNGDAASKALQSVGSVRPTQPSGAFNPQGKGHESSRSISDANFMAPSYDPSDVCYNSEGDVTGATLSALIEKMTPHDTTVEASFSNAFFLCFRLFTSPIELFEALFRRYNVAPPPEVQAVPEAMTRWTTQKMTPVRLRVLNVFKIWLELHWQPSSDSVVLGPLASFVSSSVSVSLKRSGNHLAELVQRRIADGEFAGKITALQAGGNRGPGSLKRVMSADKFKNGVNGQAPSFIDVSSMYKPIAFPSVKGAAPPAPLVSKSLLAALRYAIANREGSPGPSVLEFDPQELARQLTIMESKIFCSILPEELLGQEFSKSAGQSSAVHVKQMSALTTKITGWVTECILNEEDAKKRTQVVKHFIKLGDRLHQIKNYNALFAIQSGLNASTILRLRKTWDGVPSKYHNLMEEQRRVMEHTRNFSAYRSRIRSAIPPAMPFMGLILTDLTFCVDGNADTRPSPLERSKQLINFDKYCKLSRIISEFQRFQVPYNFVEVPEIQTYFADVIFADRVTSSSGPEDLYRRSLWLEPRPGPKRAVQALHQQNGSTSTMIAEQSLQNNLAAVSINNGSEVFAPAKSVSSRSERSGSGASSGLDLFNWK
ncbi:unnamed protein product [Parajaminaea phylloscopi]